MSLEKKCNTLEGKSMYVCMCVYVYPSTRVVPLDRHLANSLISLGVCCSNATETHPD